MDLFKRQEENDRQFIFRLGQAKETGLLDLSWQELTDIFNEQLTEIKGKQDKLAVSTYQQQYKIAAWYYEDVFKQVKDEALIGEQQKLLEELKQKEMELYKQQTRTRDAQREYRSDLRTDARIEQLKAAIREDSLNFTPIIAPYTSSQLSNQNNEAILCIGDWHIGAIVDNFYNKYNLDIAEKRINTLYQKTVDYCRTFNITTLHVVNLSDLIEGGIHATTRITSELDAIEQIKQASRLLCQLLVSLSSEIETVYYRSVVDNHSRVQPNFRDHIEKESFCKLIDWWLFEKIRQVNLEFEAQGLQNKIVPLEEKIDDGIGLFQIVNKNVFYLHGHEGNPASVVQDLTMATNIVADIVLMGHFHTDKIKNFQGKKVYFNGSLKGVDDYANKKRLYSQPTQNLLIFTENNDVVDIPMTLN